MIRVAFSLSLLLICSAQARDNGQYYNSSPELRKWFRSQKDPNTGASCCTEADGIYAEEDIRQGAYWTRFEATKGKWIRVPEETVIKGSNKNGAPVAWWYYLNGEVRIRCYAPGGGV